MKLLYLLCIVCSLALPCLCKENSKRHQRHSSTTADAGIVVHLPSDGAFQFYAFKSCGFDPISGNNTNYVEWDHEIWPSGCYPDAWARAAYGYWTWYPYPIEWVGNYVEWIPGNDVVARDFNFIEPLGFWGSQEYLVADSYTLCGDYNLDFLPAMLFAGFPSPNVYWVDFDSTGSIQVKVGAKPLNFDWYLIDGSNNPSPRTEQSVLVEDASALPMFCP